MVEAIEGIIKLVYKLIDENGKLEREELNFFVEEIYTTTEKIYNDFNHVFQKAYCLIKNGEMTVDEAIQYFDDSRLPFKSVRLKIRGVIKHPYYYRDADLIQFAIGVIGVLEGGLHDSTERILNAKPIENAIILDDKVIIKGYHTIVDVIQRYDRNNPGSLFYSEYYLHYLESDIEEIIKKDLLRDIRKQQNKIDQYWQNVCDYYPKIIMG